MVKAARSPSAQKTPPKVDSVKSTSARSASAKSVSAKPTSAKPAPVKAKAVTKSTPGRAARGKAAAGPAPSTPRAPRASAKTAPRTTVATEPGTGKTKPSAAKAGAGRAAAGKAGAGKAGAGKAGAGKATAGKSASGTTNQCAPIQLGFLSGFVGFHLRLAQDASYRAFARIREKELVKPGRFPALAIIHLNPGISQSALGRAIARDKSTVSPLIKDLQKNGLISRKPSPNDRRSVTLVLTKKGERVLDRLHARALEHEEDLDKVIGASKARLVGMLDKITSSFAAA